MRSTEELIAGLVDHADYWKQIVDVECKKCGKELTFPLYRDALWGYEVGGAPKRFIGTESALRDAADRLKAQAAEIERLKVPWTEEEEVREAANALSDCKDSVARSMGLVTVLAHKVFYDLARAAKALSHTE